MKLELKHLAPYLPYRLKSHAMGECVEGTEYDDPSTPITFTTHGFLHPNKVSIRFENVRKLIEFDEYFPILRPLSDLTKEIEHNGEKFVPMKWFEANINKSISFYQPSSENTTLEVDVLTEDYSQTIDLFDGYLVVQKLHEWHFDTQNLIENGLAIDINTLNS